MHVAIDDRPLFNSHKYRGTGWYTKRLIEALKEYTFLGYTFFSERGKAVMDADCIHYPYFEPFFVNLPYVKIKPFVVTVHDLIPLIFPEYFSKGVKGTVKWWIQRQNLKHADAIITDSEMSKVDIAQITGYAKNNIFVIPLAPGREFVPIKDRSLLWKKTKKYKLPDIFALYVGDVNYNKNIFRLISAFAQFNKKYPDVHLVLVGEAWKKFDLPETRALMNHISSFSLEKYVHFLGYVPTQDLVCLYNLAICYIQPSLYEGFGLPIIEAMACACPVVVSDIPVHREICSGVAIFFDPKNELSLVKSLVSIMQWGDLRLKQRKKAVLHQAHNYTWEKVALQTIKVYKHITF